MKKLLASLLFASALAVLGCWESDGTGLGSYTSLTTPEFTARLGGEIVSGNLTLALPAQLDIRFSSPATAATLQVRRGTSGDWQTVYTAGASECTQSSIYRPVFGRDTFTSDLVGSEGQFQFRIHVTDGVYQNFTLDTAGSAGAMTITISDNRRPVL